MITLTFTEEELSSKARTITQKVYDAVKRAYPDKRDADIAAMLGISRQNLYKSKCVIKKNTNVLGENTNVMKKNKNVLEEAYKKLFDDFGGIDRVKRNHCYWWNVPKEIQYAIFDKIDDSEIGKLTNFFDCYKI